MQTRKAHADPESAATIAHIQKQEGGEPPLETAAVDEDEGSHRDGRGDGGRTTGPRESCKRRTPAAAPEIAAIPVVGYEARTARASPPSRDT
ncbi:hypothetical protein MTO96_007301 [Rhipicephalus appendiculatus]